MIRVSHFPSFVVLQMLVSVNSFENKARSLFPLYNVTLVDFHLFDELLILLFMVHLHVLLEGRLVEIGSNVILWAKWAIKYLSSIDLCVR
jgi:hypothetical protein